MGKTAEWLWSVIMVVGAAAAVGMLALRLSPAKFGKEMFDTYFMVPNLVLYNILPIVLAACFFWFLLGRPIYGAFLSTVITMGLIIINSLKIRLRNDPFMFEDLKLASEAVNISKGYNLTLSDGIYMSLIICAGILLVVLLCTRKCHMSIRKGWLLARLLCLIAVVGSSVYLWLHIYTSDEVYQQITNENCGINHYSNVDDFQSRGFVYPFLYSYTKSVHKAPEHYNKTEAASVLEKYYEDKDIPEKKKVNVISVMLEAFTDLSQISDNEEIAEVYETLHEIEEESISGRLVTNVFAGGTCQTERCFITGYSDLGNFRSKTNSNVWYLASQGYTVEGSHPGYEWFYNRLNVANSLGFPLYYFYENHYSALGLQENMLVLDSDKLFLPELYHLMEQSIEENGKPYFSFNVSYQNHGPYTSELLLRENSTYLTEEDTGWSAESCMILNNYLSGIKDTTEQIRALLDTMEEAEEPIVFVGFGDHLPWLGDDSSVYTETGMDISLDTTEGYLNHFTTPYFIWANSAAKKVLENDFVGEGPMISPNYLMSVVFDELGWKGDAYMQYSRTIRDFCPIISESGFYGINGEIMQEVPEEYADKINMFKNIQYYRQKNYKEYK